MGVIDISYKYGEGLAIALSNLSPCNFVFDGVPCASIEGLLQSFKFYNQAEQWEICQLSGFRAWKVGQEKNAEWQKRHLLWWRGSSYSRLKSRYQKLLDKVYHSVATQNENFQRALLASYPDELIHSRGQKDPELTALTPNEYCSRLMKEREILRTREILDLLGPSEINLLYRKR